jgi:glycosyltransferase involved in cell wall biosynthesis
MISVCITTYNGEKYIKEQMDSILCQLSESDEVIVSDDSSTDATLKIIEDTKDTRIRILPNNHFYSPIYNMENALKYAKGDFIFLSDQDDIWMPHKVKVMLSALKEVDLCVSDCDLIDADGEILHSSFFKLNQSAKGFLKNVVKNAYLGCCMAFKRDILKYVLPFPKSIAMHDIWIGLCVELWGNSLFLDEKLVKYRRHDSNISPTGGKSNFSTFYKIQYRCNFLYQLLKRGFITQMKKMK